MLSWVSALQSVTPTGIEPVLPPWKGDVLTAWPRSRSIIRINKNYDLPDKKTPRVGLEPTTARLTAACSTNWAIEDYNKNTVPSLDYVSGTFFSTFKTAYSIFHPQSWTCSWYSGIIIAFVPTLGCYCFFAVIHLLAALTYSCYPAQMQSCSQSASWK